MSLTMPTTDPRWATLETNNDEPSSGKKDTGFPEGGDVISTDFNWLFFAIYTWVLYLKSALTVRKSVGPAQFTPATAGSFIGGATMDNVSWINGSGTQILAYDLDLPAGSVVSSITAGYARGASGGTTSLLLTSITAGVESGITTLLTAASGTTAYQETTVASAGLITIAANTVYRLHFKMTANTNLFFGLTDITYQRATTP